MLALKSVMAGVSAVPTLIFDEIDVGVGGRTAAVLGEKMAALSRTGQVLCVTHLPQIAGMASRHFQVRKRVAGERTWVEVRALEDAERVEELAQMLGGKEETAARHARELLAGGKAGVQAFRRSGVQELEPPESERPNARTPERLNAPVAW